MKTTAIIIAALFLVGGTLALGIVVGPLSMDQAAQINTDASFYNTLGYQLAQTGNGKDAQAAFARAVELDPNYENARSNLATIAFRNGDYDIAIVNLRVLLQQHSSNPSYHFDLAQNLASQARYKDADLNKLHEAADEFDAVNTLQPGFPHASENARIVRNVIADVS